MTRAPGATGPRLIRRHLFDPQWPTFARPIAVNLLCRGQRHRGRGQHTLSATARWRPIRTADRTAAAMPDRPHTVGARPGTAVIGPSARGRVVRIGRSPDWLPRAGQRRQGTARRRLDSTPGRMVSRLRGSCQRTPLERRLSRRGDFAAGRTDAASGRAAGEEDDSAARALRSAPVRLPLRPPVPPTPGRRLDISKAGIQDLGSREIPRARPRPMPAVRRIRSAAHHPE